MITADTSVIVARALAWHESHDLARRALGATRIRLPEHVLVESYSVLTRLPPPNRVRADIAVEHLRSAYAAPLRPPRADAKELLALAATSGIAGGAVYDALVAWTAQASKATLLTLDRRATVTYDRVGVDYRILG